MKITKSILWYLLLTTSASFANEEYSPYVKQSHPVNVYWGDTHLHTSLSIDSNWGMNKNLTPDFAYRFARGETIKSTTGGKVKLRRPLDFLVVADHAYNMGVPTRIEQSDPILLETERGRNLDKIFKSLMANPETAKNPIRRKEIWDLIGFGQDEMRDERLRSSIWQEVTAYADQYNDPGKFTAFIGYEWTSEWTGDYTKHAKGNRHRVLIFKDNATKANQVLPFSMHDSNNPAKLWEYMEAFEKKTGGEVLAIPHNGNLSNGEMFSLIDYDGKPLDRKYAETRSRWEPLYEVTQMKGDSDTHPILSPNDEFSDYQIWNSWDGLSLLAENSWDKAETVRKRAEYARSALKHGLMLKSELGVNPFKFGLVGSTDSHTSLSAAEENNYWGNAPSKEPAPKRSTRETIKQWPYSSAGYAAVWATENTREALFAAMKRKEAYATTGPRITLRFFGGWDYQPDDAFKHDLAHIGYSNGVPMGGDLTHAPKDQAPRFLIRATKDPDSANLDRVQVIKGWRDEKGELHEKIYNVALSDDRKVGKDNSVSPVGNTVDIKNASYVNSIGDAELAVVWTDPDFEASELAFYYVRVLEIPTPHWTAFDAKYFKTKILPEKPMITQERAYSTPIWYTP